MKQFHSSVPLPGPWEYIWKVLGETCYVWGHYGLQPENTRFWPLTWPWPDTWPQFWIFESGLEASRRDLSNAASPVSLRPSVFEIAGGGGSDPTPPPGCGGYRNSPGGGGLRPSLMVLLNIEGPLTPRDGLSRPRKGPLRTKECFLGSRDGPLRPRKGPFRPLEGTLRAREGPLRPREGL